MVDDKDSEEKLKAKIALEKVQNKLNDLQLEGARFAHGELGDPGDPNH